jgi:hypothetical protein
MLSRKHANIWAKSWPYGSLLIGLCTLNKISTQELLIPKNA